MNEELRHHYDAYIKGRETVGDLCIQGLKSTKLEDVKAEMYDILKKLKNMHIHGTAVLKILGDRYHVEIDKEDIEEQLEVAAGFAMRLIAMAALTEGIMDGTLKKIVAEMEETMKPSEAYLWN